MQDHRREFIELAVRHHALRFGDFTLKSGRQSPYFFNAGELSGGQSLATLGRCYAAAIRSSAIAYDLLFGPAYKGIPLAVATAIAIATAEGRDVPCAFNRKEAKLHGEGGSLIGAPLRGRRALVIDDVITAGTAVREVAELIRSGGGIVAGVVIGLDRDEKGPAGRSAVAELADELGAPVFGIARLADIVRFLEGSAELRDHLPRVLAYRERWGASS